MPLSSLGDTGLFANRSHHYGLGVLAATLLLACFSLTAMMCLTYSYDDLSPFRPHYGWKRIPCVPLLPSFPSMVNYTSFPLFKLHERIQSLDAAETCLTPRTMWGSVLPDGLEKHLKVEGDDKYFFESILSKSHTDIRYHKNLTQSAMLLVLEKITHAWSRFTESNGVVSWIAHGTLLSWLWNQKLFPWDYDLDVQMVIWDLHDLAKRFNNTIFEDRYLIDVNPHIYNRTVPRDNVIDARFIDTQNGYYIDITGLTALPPNNTEISCKSPHCYVYSDIFPLHRTIFEGVPLFRPNNVNEILVQEYMEQGLTSDKYWVYYFDGKVWKKNQTLAKEERMGKVIVRKVPPAKWFKQREKNGSVTRVYTYKPQRVPLVKPTQQRLYQLPQVQQQTPQQEQPRENKQEQPPEHQDHLNVQEHQDQPNAQEQHNLEQQQQQQQQLQQQLQQNQQPV